MKCSLAIALLSISLAAPSMVSATVLTDVTANADCEAWSVEVTVHWGASTYSAELDYVVSLTDLEGNVLEEIVFAGTLTRPEGSGQETVHFFSGSWQGDFQAPGFLVVGFVHLDAPYDDTTLNFSETVDCVVPVESVSWSTMKATYR